MKKLNPLAQFTMPVPPSVNGYLKHDKRGVTRLSDKAREYKMDAYQAIGRYVPSEPSTKRLALELIIHFGSKAIDAKRDLDNCQKLILDALEYARFFNNDQQFDEILCKRGEVIKGGLIEVTLCEIE